MRPFWEQIANGYSRLLKEGLLLILLLAAGAGLILAAVYPLWWLAINRPGLFTKGVLVLAAAGLLAAVGRSLKREPRGSRRQGLLKGLALAGKILLSLLLVYLAALFAVGGYWWAALIAAAVFFFLLGVFLFVRKR